MQLLDIQTSFWSVEFISIHLEMEHHYALDA